MGRANEVNKRGLKPAAPLPPIPSPSTAMNVQSYDGRARTNAGTQYEERNMMADAQGDGYIVLWNKGGK